MACIDYNQDQEQAHYHFTISELVYYISQYGIDKVMVDVYDMLADHCNKQVAKVQLDMFELGGRN